MRKGRIVIASTFDLNKLLDLECYVHGKVLKYTELNCIYWDEDNPKRYLLELDAWDRYSDPLHDIKYTYTFMSKML